MVMNNGDFIEIEFVGKVKATGEIFDLTNEEVAKKQGIFNEKQRYGPQTVIIGAGSVVPGVEEQLRKMGPGEEKEFDVPYAKAFGARNPKLVRILPLAKFYQQKINPVPGAFVNIDGRTCRVQSVSGGRVRVDFNHPLSNKDLHYKLKLVKKITGTKEKTQAILGMYGVEGGISLAGESAKIKLKKRNPVVEKFLGSEIKKWIKDLKKVDFLGPKTAEKNVGKEK